MYKILQDKFVKDNVVFFVGSMIIAVFNYLYHPIMSHMMSVEEFGEVQTLISLMYITGILMLVVGAVIVNIVANNMYLHTKEYKNIINQLYKLSLYVVGIFIIGMIGVSSYLAHFLQFDSIVSFLPLWLIIIVGVPSTFFSSYLRGVQRFGVVSIMGIISSAGKLVFAMIFVYVGLNVFGAITAFVIASLVALLYAIQKTKGKFKLSLQEKVVFSSAIKKELQYGFLIFISLGYITFLYTSDVLFVKHFFEPEIAGLYSGIATVGRIIFFVTASAIGVLVPSIKLEVAKKQNHAVFKKTFAIVLLLGTSIFILFILASNQVITILIGNSYLTLTSLLPLVAFYIFLVSIVNIFYAYFIALRDHRMIISSSIGFIIIIGLQVFNHNSLDAVVWNYIIGLCTTLIFVVYFFYKDTIRYLIP
jgi:O-antigen/teichoic acid export membrane protein